MDIPEEIFQSLKDGLIRINYPLIQHQTDSDIKLLLSQQQRTKFLKWVFTSLDESFSNEFEKLQKNSKLEMELIELLIDYGLCKPSECKLFVEGHQKFTYKKQLPIFQRIFEKIACGTATENLDSFDLSMFPHEKKCREINKKLMNNLLKSMSTLPSVIVKKKMDDKKEQIEAYKLELQKLEQEMTQECLNVNIDYNELKPKYDCVSNDPPCDIDEMLKLCEKVFNNIKVTDTLNECDNSSYIENDLILNVHENVQKSIQLFENKKYLCSAEKEISEQLSNITNIGEMNSHVETFSENCALAERIVNSQ